MMAESIQLGSIVQSPPAPAATGVQSVAAGDKSIVVGGTASDPTIETGSLDEIATLHPPVGTVQFNAQNLNNVGQIISSGVVNLIPADGAYGSCTFEGYGAGAIISPGGAGGGMSTYGCVTITTPTITSGTAFEPNANVDSELSFTIGAAAAGSYSVTYGPSTGAENTIVSSAALVAGSSGYFCKRIPAGWKVIVTLTSVTISDPLVQSC